MVVYRELITHKLGAECFFLLSYLYNVSPAYTKVTKKLCWEILKSKSKWSRCYDMLMAIWAMEIDNKGSFCRISTNPDFSRLSEESTEEKEVKNFASAVYSEFKGDYRSIASYSKSSHKAISSEATRLGYELSGYLSQIHTLIKWDSFWSKVITWQTFIRKFDVLSKKFTPTKNISWFDDVGSIF